ncbi:MAG: PadR family transcriptional regulator [Syntrophothermus sp.]|jgi:DNA-binding PadR family transcriptional regulator
MKLPHDLFLGFVKIHILHHAGREPVYGLWLIEELGRHGYRLSPGTLYPILHALEQEGLLACEVKVVEGKARKYYRLTGTGRTALRAGKKKARELMEEIE